MANTSKSKKAKGVKLEKNVSKRIREVLGVEAQNMPRSGALSHFKGDIYVPDLPISIECKNQELWTVHQWWEQCLSDCGLGKMPILIMSRNHQKEPLALIQLEDLLFFMELAIAQGWVSHIKKGRATMSKKLKTNKGMK